MQKSVSMLKKTIIAFCIMLFAFTYFGTIVSKADADISISVSSTDITVGDTVTVTVSLSGAYDAQFGVDYDSSVLEYVSGSGNGLVSGGGGDVQISTPEGSTTLTFRAIGNGSAGISTYGSDATDDTGSTIGISHAGVTINVGGSSSGSNSSSGNGNSNKKQDSNDGRSSECDLASLQISPGELTPAFDPATTSYYVKVEKDVTSMVVSATPASDKATTDVAGAGLIEPGDNTVTITVTAENGAVKVYTLNVVAGEDNGDAKATINGKLYHFAKIAEGLETPEGFTETKFKFKEWEVTGFLSPNKKLTICLLEDDKEEQSWFIYDAKKDAFYPYFELSAQFNRYVVLPVPDGVTVPEGFTQTEARIGNQQVVAYISQYIDDKMIYLVYAMNISGEEGFYYYDMNEKAFLRYAIPVNVPKEPEVATPTQAPEPEIVIKEVPMKDTSFFNKKMLFWILVGVSGLALIFLLVMVLALISKKRIKEELVQAEDMVAQLAKGRKGINREELIDLEDVTELPKPKKPKKEAPKEEPKKAEKKEEKQETKKPEKKPEKKKDEPKSEIERINQIELPDVDALVAEVTKDVPKEYDPDKDSAFSDDE